MRALSASGRAHERHARGSVEDRAAGGARRGRDDASGPHRADVADPRVRGPDRRRAASESAKPFVPGPDAVRFRPDEVKPWPLAFGPDKLAPAFRGGFFLVPKLGQFEEEG